LDALGDIDGKLAAFLPSALAATVRTGMVHGLAAAMTGRTGAFDREKALRLPDLAVPVTGAAFAHAGARLGTRPVAGIALHHRARADPDRLPPNRFSQPDLGIGAQVRAAEFGGASTATAGSGSAH